MIEELARCLFTEPSERYAAFRRFVELHPPVEDYACFRAACERKRAPWPKWPTPFRDGVLREGDWDEEAKRYHLYAQWLVHEQVRALSEKARQKGLGVYPDLPPLNPEASREQGYRYPIAYLGHHLKYAGFLGVDHGTGLHRLFWIQKGLEPREGVYVRYPAGEFYSILSLGSHRHKAMYIVQYERTSDQSRALRAISPDAVASLNTHDMPPFAAFWQGLDIEDRLELGLLDKTGARIERKTRQALKQALVSFLKQKGGWARRVPTPG